MKMLVARRISGTNSSSWSKSHISKFLTVMIVVVAVVVNGEVKPPTDTTTTSQHHPHHQHHHQHSLKKYPHLPFFGITNGTDQVITDGQDGFIYCFANVRFPLRVVWTDRYGRPVPWITDRQATKRNTDEEADVVIKQGERSGDTDRYGRLRSRKWASKRDTDGTDRGRDRTDSEARETVIEATVRAARSGYGRQRPWITDNRASERTTDGGTDEEADETVIESSYGRPEAWNTDRRLFKRDTDAEETDRTRTTDDEAEHIPRTDRYRDPYTRQARITNKRGKDGSADGRSGKTDRRETTGSGRGVKTDRTDTERRIFTIEGRHPWQFSFLVFKNFARDIAGSYQCSLLYGRTRIDQRTVTLHYFTPSYRVVPLPRCLRRSKGRSVIVPSPVQGKLTQPPKWTVLEGDAANVVVRKLHGGGLYLGALKGPIAWRSEVPVGGGLSFVQDVYVSVGEGRRVTVSTATGSKLCPTHTHARGHAAAADSPYASSAAVANELIASTQLNAFRRRVEGDE